MFVHNTFSNCCNVVDTECRGLLFMLASRIFQSCRHFPCPLCCRQRSGVLCLAVLAADEARQKYDTVDAKFRKIEDEIR